MVLARTSGATTHRNYTTSHGVDRAIEPLTVVVGVMAYNEASSIEASLRAIMDQDAGVGASLTEVVVVASGCTDGTDEIVRRIARSRPELTLVVQHERLGKASAVNAFFRATHQDILVLIGGDVILAADALRHLVQPLVDGAAAMTGGRPAPTNDCRGVSRAVHVLWDLHHLMAMKSPKLGEVVAFRRLCSEIDEQSLVDELEIEAQVSAQGGKLKYVPEAVAYNHGPTTISDFLAQRRRIFLGHLYVLRGAGYAASTMDSGSVLAASRDLLRQDPGRIFDVLLAAALEATARCQAWFLLRFAKKRHALWRPITSSKRVLRQGQRVRRAALITTELHLPLAWNRNVVSVLRSTIRARDRIVRSQGCIAVVVRGDAVAASDLRSRLMRDLGPSFDSATDRRLQVTSPSPRQPSA